MENLKQKLAWHADMVDKNFPHIPNKMVVGWKKLKTGKWKYLQTGKIFFCRSKQQV